MTQTATKCNKVQHSGGSDRRPQGESPQFVSLRAMSALTGIHYRTLRKALELGKLTARRFGSERGKYSIEISEMKRFLGARDEEPSDEQQNRKTR